MNGAIGKPRQRGAYNFISTCAVMLLWVVGCASADDVRSAKKFSRLGESATVAYGVQAVSNAIVSWAQTLTNGYVLWDDRKTRLNHTSLTNDPAILFMLRNGTNAIGPWGSSACLPSDKSSYWADIIIRVVPVPKGSRISVAVHGGRFASGLAWNFHTYGFNSEKEKDLPPCSEDERKILGEIESDLRTTAGQ